MNITEFPIVESVVSIGPDSRVFDGLLVGGPLLVLIIVVLGRNAVTVAFAVSYLLLFLAGVGYAAVERR